MEEKWRLYRKEKPIEKGPYFVTLRDSEIDFPIIDIYDPSIGKWACTSECDVLAWTDLIARYDNVTKNAWIFVPRPLNFENDLFWNFRECDYSTGTLKEDIN